MLLHKKSNFYISINIHDIFMQIKTNDALELHYFYPVFIGL